MKVTDDYIILFGIHKGKKMANIPANYLLWLYNNNKCYGDIKQYIKNNEKLLKLEVHENDCDATEFDIY